MEAGQDMGYTSSQDLGYTLGVCSFLSCRAAAALVPPAKRLDGMVGDWDSADGKRGFELPFALPIVRVGAQSSGIPQGGPGGSTIVLRWSCLNCLINAVPTLWCGPMGKIDSLKSDMRRFDFV